MESLRYPGQRESLRLSESQILCEDHPHEPVTNFCFASLRALCPSCIDNHNKMMKQNNMFPEIDTLRNVKLNCTKKCQSAIAALQSELGNLDSQMITNPKAVIEEGIFEIRRARDKLISFINKYVETIEAEYERSITDAVSKATNYSDVGDKITSLIQELEHLMYNIESPSCVPTVKKICMIDLKALLEKFRGDVHHTLSVRENLATNFSQININDALFPSVTDSIHRYLSLNVGRPAAAAQRNTATVDNNRSFQPPQRLTEHEKSSHNIANHLYADETQEDPGFLQFHKEYRNDHNEEFPVTLNNYFEPGCTRRYLHFFQNYENRLHYIDVSNLSKNASPNFESTELNIDFTIPPFHRSMAVPNGDIYLIGGSDVQDPALKLNTNFLFDWGSRALVQRAPMNVPRSSFAICYMNRYIYVAGGLTDNSTFTRRCERYEIATNKWSNIADLNYDVIAPCMTAFNDRYIFKFGGYNQDMYLEPYVEKYDPNRNVWMICRLRIELPGTIRPEYFKILSTSACVQINAKEIYVFGGYLEDNTSSNQTFVLRVDKEDDENAQNYTVTKVGVKSLTHPEAFWNNNPIIFNKQVYALQNVQTIEQEDVCLDYRRRLICFDSYDWSSLA